MAEETFRLRKLHPPFGTESSPLWEFGYDDEVRVADGLCEVRSPALRDRLLKMGYEAADEDTPAPASPKKRKKGKAKPRGWAPSPKEEPEPTDEAKAPAVKPKEPGGK